MDYFIGIDIGTSSVKVAAFSQTGSFLAKEAKAYPLNSPKPSYQEQDPGLIFQSMLETCKAVIQQMEGRLIAISFSSAMHSLLALDKQGQPITPLITWADGRATAVTKSFKTLPESQLIYQETGTPIHPMSPLCKLIWMKEEAADIFAKADKWIGIKGYILYRLFGCLLMDYSLASATGLFHLKTKKWHKGALEKAGIDESRLPELVPTDHVLKNLKKQFAVYLEIPDQTPFVIGASDGCLANLGAMALNAQQTVITIGTSAALRTTLKQPLADQQARIFNYWLDEDLFVVGGASNNGGVLLDWFRKKFMPGKAVEEVLAQVNKVPPGSTGLLFFPYLLGERAPLWDPAVRASFQGVSIQHGPDHFIRAILEGICFNLFLIGEALRELGYPIHQIYANGGFTNSEMWVQMLADIFDKTIHIQGHQEGSAFGAVLVAMKALGLIESYEEMKHVVLPEKTFVPNPAQVSSYQQTFKEFYSHYSTRF